MPLFSNIPALRLTISYLIHDPPSLLSHHTVPTLLSLPLPLGPALSPSSPKIRALVIDKDNTLCPPKTAKMHITYIQKLQKIRDSEEFSHNGSSVLIVSNTAGSSRLDFYEAEALELENELGVPVLRQEPGSKKPLCGPDVLRFFKDRGVTDNPSEIAVVGDRLATDVLMAREMGSWSVWCRDGWRNPEMPGVDHRGIFAKTESQLERILRGGLQMKAPLPAGYVARRK